MNINTSILKKEEEAIFRLRELYGRYGYSQYKMRKFEEYDLYARNKNFLISGSVITFTDTNGRLMALKPDVTLSIVKNNKCVPGQVQKVYYNENVYRISEKSHSYREIMQVGLEALGDIDAYCIGEVLSLARQSLAAINEDYILNVSHMGLLSLGLDRIGISDGARDALLDHISHKSLHDAEELCRRESLGEDRIAIVRALITCTGAPDIALPRLSALFADDAWQAAVKELEETLLPLPSERTRIDLSLVSDMRYYNGIVFAGFVKGVPERILSGGQYDKLMERMEKRAGAIGFAVYLDCLESLETAPGSYDIDTVLLYSPTVSPRQLHSTVDELIARGLSVTAQKTLPEKLKYRQLLKLTESGVETVEINA